MPLITSEHQIVNFLLECTLPLIYVLISCLEDIFTTFSWTTNRFAFLECCLLNLQLIIKVVQFWQCLPPHTRDLPKYQNYMFGISW